MSICASVIQFKLIPRLLRLSPFCNGEPALFFTLWVMYITFHNSNAEWVILQIVKVVFDTTLDSHFIRAAVWP